MDIAGIPGELEPNPFKFFSYCKINDANKNAVVDFEPWAHLKKIVSAIETDKLLVILKSRQVGISFILAFYALFKALTTQADTTLILSAGEKESQLLLAKSKFAYANLPKWLQIPYGKWTETEITFPSLGSQVLALPSTQKAGIGFTASRVLIDEWDYHPYPDSDFAAAEPTASAGGQILGASTINPDSPPDSFFKELYKQARRGENNFTPIFLPWSIRPGRDVEWFENEKKNYVGRMWFFEKNYPVTEQQALSPLSARSFFNTNKTIGVTLEDLMNGCTEPIETIENCVYVYQKWRNGVSYVAGADVSEGVGQDYQALIILGKSGMVSDIVAIIHSKYLSIEAFVDLIYRTCKDYNFPLLAVERNAIGIAAVNSLQSIPYPRMYYEKDDRVGWTTKPNTREIYLRELAEGLAKGTTMTRFKPMVMQMFNFQKTENKVRAVGDHDDLVMAYSIAYQLALKAPNMTLSGVKKFQRIIPRKTTGILGR